ncbi:MAG TPA: hydroxyisourate hydrolase [Ktedonobacterales bacterium]|jgi:5-hydroxyisourate hydrolase
MSGYLTTHVLDLAQGRPAAGMRVELWRLADDGARTLDVTTVTNADGRVDEPLLAGEAFQTGTYELLFDVGSYFAAQGLGASPPFLTSVPVRFTIADLDAHYHVPLLVTPWAYSTYRGS